LVHCLSSRLMDTVKLKRGKSKAAHQRHPWVFSGALADTYQKPKDGAVVQVVDDQDQFVAYGWYNSHSRVAVRLIEWDVNQFPDESWARLRVQQAIHARSALLNSVHTDTLRLVFAEADFLPGLIVDKYADFLSVQIHAAGINQIRDVIADELNQLLRPKGI